MAASKSTGNGQVLWPRGCTSIDDVSVDLATAISHALKILSWYEVYTKNEIPPEWMWPLDHELEDWFEEVHRQRSQGLPTGTDEEPVSMERNEYAARMREG